MTAAHGQIIAARATIDEEFISRAAKALEREDTINGVAVWHVRDGRKKVTTSLPMPHELHTIDEVTACADLAEKVASSHTNLVRVMGTAVSVVLASVVVIGANAVVAAISEGFDGGLPNQWLMLITLVIVFVVGFLVVGRVEREINAPEVWERRALAYRRRLAELEQAAQEARGCPCPGHERPRRRRWWRQSR